MLSLQMNAVKALGYDSPSQRAKHVTEDWVQSQLYCLRCGKSKLEYPNQPVLDFECSNCKEQYELKSKKAGFGSRVLNSAYEKKIEKIRDHQNPSFLFLEYDRPSWTVVNLFALPRHLFFPEMIERRKPLRETAKRAGWVGSIIELAKLPVDSRVYVVRDGVVTPERIVLEKWALLSLFQKIPLELRGWALDVWNLIKEFQNEFTLLEVYQFEDSLRSLHPQNKHVRDKIRQQLQVLRDAGFVEFKGKGKYAMRKRTVQAKLA
jgi:type II restriction enzyme